MDICVFLCSCVSLHVPHGTMSDWQNKSTEKGQAGVDTQFSLGHRWRGGQSVRLRLGVMWRRGLRNVCARACVRVQGRERWG